MHPDDHDHDHDHWHPHYDEARAVNGSLLGWLAGLAVVAIASLLIYRSFYFVDETEYVYVTQFGEPLELRTEPGLGLKWPYQSLWRFDRRLHMYEPPAREMLTQDKENLNFNWFVCWRIPSREFAEAHAEPPTAGQPGASPSQAEPLERYVSRFLQSVGTREAAESRLEERIQAALAAEIGRTEMQQLVSLDAASLQLDAMLQRVTREIRQVAAEQFGIEVVDVQLKRFNYPEAVKPAVYAEIRSERERVAVQYRAEGASQKQKIESLAALQRDQLLAQAKRDATRIRGEAEAKAIEIFNSAHSKDPEFYRLLKTLETYRAILDDQTTVVLSADSPLLELLTRGLPPVEQADALSTTQAEPGDEGAAGDNAAPPALDAAVEVSGS